MAASSGRTGPLTVTTWSFTPLPSPTHRDTDNGHASPIGDSWPVRPPGRRPKQHPTHAASWGPDHRSTQARTKRYGVLWSRAAVEQHLVGWSSAVSTSPYGLCIPTSISRLPSVPPCILDCCYPRAICDGHGNGLQTMGNRPCRRGHGGGPQVAGGGQWPGKSSSSWNSTLVMPGRTIAATRRLWNPGLLALIGRRAGRGVSGLFPTRRDGHAYLCLVHPGAALAIVAPDAGRTGQVRLHTTMYVW